MTFTKECDYRWTCGIYEIKRHHCGGGEKFSAWISNQILGYRDSYEQAEKECERQEYFDREYK